MDVVLLKGLLVLLIINGILLTFLPLLMVGVLGGKVLVRREVQDTTWLISIQV
jgi:hypothetical protein